MISSVSFLISLFADSHKNCYDHRCGFKKSIQNHLTAFFRRSATNDVHTYLSESTALPWIHEHFQYVMFVHLRQDWAYRLM